MGAAARTVQWRSQPKILGELIFLGKCLNLGEQYRVFCTPLLKAQNAKNFEGMAPWPSSVYAYGASQTWPPAGPTHGHGERACPTTITTAEKIS